MTMFYYKSWKLMRTATCYKSDNDDKSDNNEDKVCLLVRR